MTNTRTTQPPAAATQDDQLLRALRGECVRAIPLPARSLIAQLYASRSGRERAAISADVALALTRAAAPIDGGTDVGDGGALTHRVQAGFFALLADVLTFDQRNR